MEKKKKPTKTRTSFKDYFLGAQYAGPPLRISSDTPAAPMVSSGSNSATASPPAGAGPVAMGGPGSGPHGGGGAGKHEGKSHDPKGHTPEGHKPEHGHGAGPHHSEHHEHGEHFNPLEAATEAAVESSEKARVAKGGPGSGTAEDNTEMITMPQSTHVSIGTRKGLLDNMQYHVDDAVPMKDITHVAQEKYQPDKLKKMLANHDEVKNKPIDLLKVGDEYHVIDGHHRFLAAKKMGMATIPARVRVRPENLEVSKGAKGSGPHGGAGKDDAPEVLKSHGGYSQEDYKRLSKRGFTNAQIKKIWDRDLESKGIPITKSADTMPDFQCVVEGMDWELAHSDVDEETAYETVLNDLDEDPDYYKKLYDRQSDTGARVDVGSGTTREPGYIGIDTYPYDHGTIVQDAELGLPFEDNSVSHLRMANTSINAGKIAPEINRVLKPGGQFTYEGQNDLRSSDDFSNAAPDLEHTSTDGNGPFRQTFTKGAVGKVVHIMKANAMKQIVYGVVLEPNSVDTQDEYMTADEIEKAAHIYLEKARVVGSQHTKAVSAVPVESYIAPHDLVWDGGANGPQTVKKGSWVLGVKITDPAEWQKVLDGSYTGFSVGGFGKRDKKQALAQ